MYSFIQLKKNTPCWDHNNDFSQIFKLLKKIAKKEKILKQFIKSISRLAYAFSLPDIFLSRP